MAFFSKVGSLLRQTASKQISSEISASRPSLYQAIRCMSSSKLFVGGLSYQTDEQGLREAFAKYGYVNETRVITDRETGRSRGFGFVTFNTPEEATSAIQALDGQELHGRRVRVNYATDRARGGGYGGNYGGQGSYGGGSYGGQGSYGSGSYGGQGSYGGGSYGGNYGNNAYGAPSGNDGGNTVDNYGSGGNYGSGYSGENASYGGPGNYSSGNTFDSGNAGGFSSGGGSYSVAGGGSGIDGGFDGNTGVGFGGGNQLDSSDNQFDSNESASSFTDTSEPSEGNTRNDFEDDDGDFAKRA